MTTESILTKLRAQASVRWVKRLALLSFGLPLCFAAPLIMGSIFWLAGFGLGWWGMSWTMSFWINAAVFVPLLFGLEARTAGRYLADTVVSTGGVSEDRAVAAIAGLIAGLPSTVVAVGMNPRASLAGIVEMFLIGPRMVLSAVNDFRACQRIGKVDLPRAAALMARLAKSPSGIEPSTLLIGGETLHAIAPVVAYLAYYQWIGIAAAGDRVWLTSDVRKRLG